MDQCKRYTSRLEENTTTPTTIKPNFSGINDRMRFYNYNDDGLNGDSCMADNFDQNQIEICSSDNLIFRDNEVTISNDVSIFIVRDHYQSKSTVSLSSFHVVFYF